MTSMNDFLGKVNADMSAHVEEERDVAANAEFQHMAGKMGDRMNAMIPVLRTKGFTRAEAFQLATICVESYLSGCQTAVINAALRGEPPIE